MTIDIVDLTDEAYSDLSPVQMAMVRAAQRQKNAALTAAEREKQELYFQLVCNNTARNSVYACACERIDAETESKVEAIRSDLNYQLAYEALGSEGNEYGPYRYPENPNYTLSPSQRFLVVRNYYMQATDDPQARLDAYAMDTLARQYLGEFYATLYDLLASYCSS